MLIAAVFLAVSCGGGKKDKNSCPDGYEWSGTDCVKKSGGDVGDTALPDTEPQPDSGDTVDDSETTDDDADTEEPDGGDSAYTGECTEIYSGDSFEINVETKKLTIGDVTVNGVADDDALYGELWGENNGSDFKIADVNSQLSGKSFNLPKGKYNFAYRPDSSANRTVIAENIDMASGDRTLDFKLPLYHLKGKVVNNSDAVFTVEEAYQAETKLVLKTSTFEKEIPYSEFGGYDLLLPKGTYSVYFKGQLAEGQGMFEGTVLSSENGIVLEGDTDKDIKVATITFAGSIVKDGYAVNEGQLILAENPPFGAKSGVVAADLSTATDYSITVTTGADLNLMYVPAEDSYPTKYIKLELKPWNSQTDDKAAHKITLDFARVHGKITFLGGNNFPTAAKCGEEDCTIGKLKAVGGDQTSYVIKNLGKELTLDGEESVTYDALLLRRIASTDADGNSQYTVKTYDMKFESYLNDAAGIFKSLPFTVSANYDKNGTKTSSFSFQEIVNVVDDDGNQIMDESGQPQTKIEWVTEKELNFDVSPAKISGKATLNGSALSTEKGDLIKLKDENGIEYAVLNLSELTGGEYSFYAPNGTYDVIYDGEGILANNFKTYIERDLEITGDAANHELAVKTGKVTLDFNVNGTPFAEWMKAQKSLESVGLAVNIDKTASDFVLPLSEKEGKYSAEVLTGSVLNVYLELAFADKVASEKSYTRIPLLSSHNMTSGAVIRNDLSLVNFNLSVKLNGNAVNAAEYAAKFRLKGTYTTEIFMPADASVGAFMLKREYKTPTPELYLNEGFDTQQNVELDCLYLGE